MSRKVVIEIKVKLVLDVNSNVDVNDVIDDMEYDFTPNHDQASFVDSEILDYEVIDSR